MASDRVTVATYDTTDEAKMAEELLLDSGLSKDIVSRAGKSIRVVTKWEDEARSVLGTSMSGSPGTDAAATADDDFLASTEPAMGATVSAYGTVDPLETSTTAADPFFDPMTTSTAATSDVSMTDPALTTDPVLAGAPVWDADIVLPDAPAADATTSASATDKVKDATSTVSDTATGAASTVASTVSDAASSATDTAQQAAGAVVDKVQDATSTVTSQVGQVAGTVAERVQTLAQTLREKGATEDAPAIQQQAAQTTAGVLEKTAQYLRQGDLGVVAQDLRGVVRRSPGRSLLAAFAIGYVARATLLKGGGSQSQGASTQSSGPAPSSMDHPADDTVVATVADYDTVTVTDVTPAVAYTDAAAGTYPVGADVEPAYTATVDDIPVLEDDPLLTSPVTDYDDDVTGTPGTSQTPRTGL